MYVVYYKSPIWGFRHVYTDGRPSYSTYGDFSVRLSWFRIPNPPGDWEC